MHINKIIIGVDDSKYAHYAARYGFSIARKFNAEIGLVNIIQPYVSSIDTSDSLLGMPLADVSSPEEMDLINSQSTMSERIIDGIIKEFGEGLTVSHFSEYGSTADGILECSKEFEADLIVVGTHKRSGLDRFFMGDVAEGVMRHAKVPVLVVPFNE